MWITLIRITSYNVCYTKLLRDIVKIYNETKIPVIAIMEKEPDLLKMKSALKKYFFDFPEKIEILESFPKPEPFENRNNFV